jgi:hypothetical protein
MTQSRPIIFSADSVRSILDGRKTQTRRVVKQHKVIGRDIKLPPPLPPSEHPAWGWSDEHGFPIKSPGSTSARLWVKEPYYAYGDTIPHYKTDALPFLDDDVEWEKAKSMPRRLSRLTLEIVSVRCERLQDISEADVRAEGYETKEAFIAAWDKLNAKRGCGWETNCWVWCVEFKTMKGEI